MKISLLSGAYKNAGDFLIVDRCKKLLKNEFPDASITEYKRNIPLDKYVSDINDTDVLVFAGGPAYVEYLYPEIMPLVKDLDEIKIPFFAMAMGWRGHNGLPKTIYTQQFSDRTWKLMKRFERDGFSIGCRDVHTTAMLRHLGIHNTIMTGCAAWYDINTINSHAEKYHGGGKIHRILISDPAQKINHNQCIEVIKLIRRLFPDSEISFVFHRGINEKLANKVKSMDINIVDISSSKDGFEIYDSCDLHIGYRVHAHIYNLSHMNRSILIEEDGRGSGVNESLGLRHITAYDTSRLLFSRNCLRVANKLGVSLQRAGFICEELTSYITELESSNYIQIKWAFNRIQHYYSCMRKHILELKSLT